MKLSGLFYTSEWIGKKQHYQLTSLPRVKHFLQYHTRERLCNPEMKCAIFLDDRWRSSWRTRDQSASVRDLPDPSALVIKPLIVTQSKSTAHPFKTLLQLHYKLNFGFFAV